MKVYFVDNKIITKQEFFIDSKSLETLKISIYSNEELSFKDNSYIIISLYNKSNDDNEKFNIDIIIETIKKCLSNQKIYFYLDKINDIPAIKFTLNKHSAFKLFDKLVSIIENSETYHNSNYEELKASIKYYRFLLSE